MQVYTTFISCFVSVRLGQ